MDKNCTYSIGIDEAGRGPVLGPMLYGGVMWKTGFEKSPEITKSRMNDSKALDAYERDQILNEIEELKADKKLDYYAIDVSPQYLSSIMMSDNGLSLNEISENCAFEIINHFLNQGYKIQDVFVDTVGPPEKYKNLLNEKFKGRNINFKVEKKADSTYKIVSAASIVAKVFRDNSLKNWQFEENVKYDRGFGSGYPGDAITKAWLSRSYDKVFGLPTLARFCWQTTETFIEEKCVKRKFLDEKVSFEVEKLWDMNIKVSRTYKAEINKHKLYKDFNDIFEVDTNFSL